MTKFKGMLLFDIPEDSINGWENQLGYRGMMEVWKKGDYEIVIEPYEDGEEEVCDWEVSIRNEKTGSWESIGFGDEEEADKIAKEYMAKN